MPRLYKLPIRDRRFEWGTLTATWVGGSGPGQREIIIPIRINQDDVPEDSKWDYRYSSSNLLLIQANLQKDETPGLFLHLSSYVPEVASRNPIVGYVYVSETSLPNVKVLAIGYIGDNPRAVHQEAIVRTEKEAEFYLARTSGIDQLVQVNGYEVTERIVKNPSIFLDDTWLRIDEAPVTKLFRGRPKNGKARTE